MYCQNCGKHLEEGASFCDQCGRAALDTYQHPQQMQQPLEVRVIQEKPKETTSEKAASWFWSAVGVFVILFILSQLFGGGCVFRILLGE